MAYGDRGIRKNKNHRSGVRVDKERHASFFEGLLVRRIRSRGVVEAAVAEKLLWRASGESISCQRHSYKIAQGHSLKTRSSLYAGKVKKTGRWQ